MEVLFRRYRGGSLRGAAAPTLSGWEKQDEYEEISLPIHLFALRFYQRLMQGIQNIVPLPLN